MTSELDRRASWRLSLSQSTLLESPPVIAGLFLILFDIKAGYMISWSRSIPDVELEGAVEYKSLPSGLHNVAEDLVYFVHDSYAGISAFVNRPAAEAERNALMLAVGVLVPLSSGRLGKSWRHAAGLKELALGCAQDPSDTQPLVDYWERYRIEENDSATPRKPPTDSPQDSQPESQTDTLQRSRAFSDATALEMIRPALPPFHPALSLPDLINSFGPLIFPLYRASLLRKRILLVTEVPVQQPCDYVYNLSLLASLPQSLLSLLPERAVPPIKARSFFNIGIHDIPFLSSFTTSRVSGEPVPGWIACTTDNVLTLKSDLYDVLVTLPPYSKHAPQRIYPRVTILHYISKKPKQAEPTLLRATQRDMRRFVSLRDGLRRLPRNDSSLDQQGNYDSDASSTLTSASIVEQLSWPQLAYTSFIWWASAGERRAGMSEEELDQAELDACLLADVGGPSIPSGSVRRQSLHSEEFNQQPQEIALIVYFRRLTTLIFTTLSDAILRQDDAEYDQRDSGSQSGYEHEPRIDGDIDEVTENSFQEHDPSEPLLRSGGYIDLRREGNVHDTRTELVSITTSDMTQMGLDPWSATDRIFVDELLTLWWGRKAQIDETRIRCCGIPIF